MLGLAAVPGAALAISMVFVPHSPRWLASKGRRDEARGVLARTRTQSSIDAELRDIDQVTQKARTWSLRALFGARARPLMLVGIGLAVFQQFVGINTVIYFTSTILRYTGASLDQSILLAVYVGVTNLVATIVAVLVLDWIGRRWLLVAGTGLLTLSLFALGAYFWWPQLSHQQSWVGLACVIAYIVGFAVGLGPVFWLMISEIYPLQFRSKAMAIATIVNWAANFIVSYFFLQEVAAIGQGPTFWIYGLVGIAAVLFFWFKVPETKNRPLEDIERAIGGERLRKAVSGEPGKADHKRR
jgi:sugar porter (SP) family MFS transporter